MYTVEIHVPDTRVLETRKSGCTSVPCVDRGPGRGGTAVRVPRPTRVYVHVGGRRERVHDRWEMMESFVSNFD